MIEQVFGLLLVLALLCGFFFWAGMLVEWWIK